MARSRSASTSPKTPPVPTDLNLSALEDALAQAPDGIIRNVSPRMRRTRCRASPRRDRRARQLAARA